MFPSSFSIKASLGNLKISDDSLHSNHMYFWACDMRNPGGSSFVEVSLKFFDYTPLCILYAFSVSVIEGEAHLLYRIIG